ncbi:AAA family ATPase [Candidatus Uabimicrobium amorphum]|uniref:Serine/threonine protein kinase n=1 Tax=Uabimicrobium amorphum TaxID=2596890 RepID=A0A5S9IMV0_UABAM|nr:AAA family ATPase [Candidatus Uabimicrobium amorphum]BBM83960.1 serine/threonine protein kinase [Candidatus Uabimicrobium amorphum]
MKLSETFLSIVIDALRYIETQDPKIKDRLVDELDKSFSLLHTLSSEMETPYTKTYIDIVASNRNDSLIALLESEEPCLQGVPENLEKWQTQCIERLKKTYLNWQDNIQQGQLRLYLVIAFSQTGLLGSLRMSSYNPLPHQRIQGDCYDTSIARSLDDARKIVKYYWQAKYKLPTIDVDESLHDWAIEWGSSLFEQFENKPITGQSFTFAFTILFFISSLRILSRKNLIEVYDYKSGKRLEPHELVLPHNTIASGAFLRDQIPDESLTPKNYKPIATQRVAGVQTKLDIISQANSIHETLNFFLIPKDNYFDIQVQDPNVTVVPIENLDDLITHFFRDWSIVSQQVSKDATTRVDVKNFIQQALELTKQLSYIHQQNKIYKYLTIDCITSSIEQIKLLDPTEAASLALRDPQSTVAYISPEQSNYLELNLDYRADFYSLGVIFYQMLTTKLPFNANSIREFIIAHISQKIIPPHDVIPQIPLPISDIILKMLKKNPDDRYKSITSIINDLSCCQKHIRNDKPDVYETLVLPKKLYGRDEEYRQLEKSWENFLQGHNQIVMVHGMPGIGKTTLVNSFLPRMLQENAMFLSGKYQQNITSSSQNALIQTAQKFCAQVLTSSPEIIAEWRQKILDALDTNIRVVVDAIPGFDKLVGEQPPPSPLPPEESRNRFYLSIEKLMQTVIIHNEKSVLFLDDVQWIDEAALHLLGRILGKFPKKLFVILAARDSGNIDKVKDIVTTKGLQINELFLNSLPQKAIKNIVCHLFSPTADDTEVFSEVIYQKTIGNPLFTKQFLQVIWQNKLLHFSHENHCWSWQIDKIEKLDFSHDILTSIYSKTSQLLTQHQEILKICACMENFTLEMLRSIAPQYNSYLESFMQTALQRNYIRPLQPQWILSSTEQKYCFAHDLVHQSIYDAIDEQLKKQLHYKIGLYYREHDYTASNIADQWNLCRPLLDREQKQQLAQFNFQAMTTAKNLAAYSHALAYIHYLKQLTTEIELPANLLSQVRQQEALLTYLSGDFSKAEKLLLDITKTSNNRLETAQAHIHLVMLYTHIGDWDRSFIVGKEGLNHLGIDWLSKNALSIFVKELMTVKANLRKLKSTPDCFVNLPELKDQKQKMALQLLAIFMNTTYYGGKIYALLTAIKMVNITVKDGFSIDSTHGYSYFAMLLGHIKLLGSYTLGRNFIEWAVQLSEVHDNPLHKGRVYFGFGSVVNHWTQSIDKNLEYLQKAKRYSLQAGDLLFASYATVHPLPIYFFSGSNLTQLFHQAEQAQSFLEEVQFESQEFFPLGLQKFITHIGDIPSQKMKKHLDVADYTQQEKKIKNTTGIIWLRILEMKYLYLNNDYRKALHNAKEAQNYTEGAFGQIMEPEYHYYCALILLALYPRSRKSRVSKKVHHHLRKLRKWQNNCPENFAHKYLIVQSEILRVENKFLKAMKSYQRAIAETKKIGFVHQQALANELAANMYFQLQIDDVAKVYTQQAITCYTKWGATKKARQLQTLLQQKGETNVTLDK